jgi:hypothetical protein
MVVEKGHCSHEFRSLSHGAAVKDAVELEAGIPQQIAGRRCAVGKRFRWPGVAAQYFGCSR